MVAPVPIGPGAVFSDVPAGSVATAEFTLGEGYAVVTFQPVDIQNPGVATLYDGDDVAVLTIDAEGYSPAIVPPGGGTYYFKATLGAKRLAMTLPTVWR